MTDFISFADFAPTILAAAGLQSHAQMTGRSFLDVLTSKASGRIDASRDRVVIVKERHDLGRPNDVGYPTRAIRTDEYLYIRHFEPERWPACDPPSYRNIDNSPTKSLIIELKDKGESRFWDLAMGKRPQEELYRVADDPDCVKNLAADPPHAEVKARLWKELGDFLLKQGDPRILGAGDVFDHYEYSGPRGDAPARPAASPGSSSPARH